MDHPTSLSFSFNPVEQKSLPRDRILVFELEDPVKKKEEEEIRKDKLVDKSPKELADVMP